MGVRTTISGDVQHIDLSKVADDMLADVIADHAAERFRASNRANRELAGSDIAYSVMVDGRVVHAGRGDMSFPERRVSTILQSGMPVRGRHSIVIDWLWHKLQMVTLKRIISSFDSIGNISDLAKFIANPRGELLGFLLKTYLRSRYPALAARSEQIQVLWKVYRLARTAGLVGSDDQQADPDVLAWIAGELIKRSPVLSGAYRDAHALYADQRHLMAAEAVTADSRLPSAKEFSFTNTMPYARKIEFGKTQSGRDFVVQVPNRIYERVAKDAQARFRGLADIAFEMRAVIDDTQTPQRRARPTHNKPGVRYPSIVVSF